MNDEGIKIKLLTKNHEYYSSSRLSERNDWPNKLTIYFSILQTQKSIPLAEVVKAELFFLNKKINLLLKAILKDFNALTFMYHYNKKI